jgi:SAM-dependent methyltransferase
VVGIPRLTVPELSIRKSIQQWWRRARADAGLVASWRKLLALAWEFVRDSTPERKRQRYGDIDYDWEHRVDTTSATVGWRMRLLGLLHTDYQPIEPELFREMIAGLSVDLHDLTFIDIGSGKGRALLLACEYPFRRILGIELLPQLNEIARLNIRKFAESHDVRATVEAFCGDATDFTFPAEPLVLFLFNPLPDAELREVIGNLDGSLRQDPREAYVVYANPVWEEIIKSNSPFTKIGGTHQYALFRFDPSRTGIE